MSRQPHHAPDYYQLTPRERFIAALERRPIPGRVPHFELVFFLTMEAFGKLHPTHRSFYQWGQMSEFERELHRRDMAETYILSAETFEHDALFPQIGGDIDEIRRQLDWIRELSGDRFFLMIHGDSTYSIPDGHNMEQLSLRMANDPKGVLDDAKRMLEDAVKRAQILKAHGAIDGFALCSDYCFNTGPFLPLPWFDQFVTPFLKKLIKEYRRMGFYTIKHTDGNIMPILDQLLDANPHALHSLDPQGGVDMAEIVEKAAHRVCLCGNVNCGLIQTGSEDEVVKSARYALTYGMQSPGYIFCTSNCVYTGMELDRYRLILEVWRNEGIRTTQNVKDILEKFAPIKRTTPKMAVSTPKGVKRQCNQPKRGK